MHRATQGPFLDMHDQRQPLLVWLRADLRLTDNTALGIAAQSGQPIIPVFIWTPEEEAPWEPGSAVRWWLHSSLEALDASLQHIRSRLVLRRGPALTALRTLARETGATHVFVNEQYEPAVWARDREVEAGLAREGVTWESFPDRLLFDPEVILTRSGEP
jgi:deoxyribodipyrimidine photo-lyase